VKRFLLISALIFVGILASANLCAQDDITNTVKNVNDELYAPEPENSLVWRKQGDVSNTLYAYDQIYKMMRQISGMEQVFPTGTSVNIFSKEGSRRMVTPLPGIYIYVIAKYADGTIAFDIRSPEGNHLKLLEGLYDDLNPNSDWWEPVTEVLAAGELKVGPKGTITMINETAGILKTRPDIAAKLLIPGTSISNIKALMALDANFAKCFSINVKYISYDKNDMHLSP
jgi:hypothetical protein